MDLTGELTRALVDLGAPAGAEGKDKKNYTEKVSQRLAALVAARLRDLGLENTRAPEGGRDKQFMGGYGTKGVDVYLSDEKHGLLLTSGIKGILFDVRKNLKNRYRDLVMEALELHKRFPYAVCAHLLFLSRSEVERSNQAFGTVLGEAVALLSGITGRRRPDEPAELYEVTGIVLLEPGDPASVVWNPDGVPAALSGGSYCERLVRAFQERNPFFRE